MFHNLELVFCFGWEWDQCYLHLFSGRMFSVVACLLFKTDHVRADLLLSRLATHLCVAGVHSFILLWHFFFLDSLAHRTVHWLRWMRLSFEFDLRLSSFHILIYSSQASIYWFTVLKLPYIDLQFSSFLIVYSFHWTFSQLGQLVCHKGELNRRSFTGFWSCLCIIQNFESGKNMT